MWERVKPYQFNSFSAKGKIGVLANNADSPEISIVCRLVVEIVQTLITLEMEESSLNNSALKELNV